MNNVIIEMFNYMANKLNIVIDWSQEEIYPILEDVWEKFIQYELLKNITNFIGFFMLLCISIVFFYEFSLAAKEVKNNKISDGVFFIDKFINDTVIINKSYYTYIGIILATIFLLLSITALLIILVNIIKLCIIPENYILTIFNLL